MKVAHLGINAANTENAAQIAELFHVLFGFEPKYGNSSIFAVSYTHLTLPTTPYV